MTINLKNLLNPKLRISKMGDFQGLKKIGGLSISAVSADLYDNTADQSPSRKERVTVTPNPTSADKDDAYTYTTTLEFFDDTLNYDEETGNDV